jgi:hypothetical protein
MSENPPIVPKKLIQQWFLEAFPNPERIGCPDEDALQAVAQDHIKANDPTALHIGSCSECYREYLHLRREWEEERGNRSTTKVVQ